MASYFVQQVPSQTRENEIITKKNIKSVPGNRDEMPAVCLHRFSSENEMKIYSVQGWKELWVDGLYMHFTVNNKPQAVTFKKVMF